MGENLGKLDDMKSEINSFKTIKQKFKKGVIEALNYIKENESEILRKSGILNPDVDQCKAILRGIFSNLHSKECTDESLLSNSRWGIVAKKNVFGLKAILFPINEEKGKNIILEACAGRFQTEKFPHDFFPKTIDITNIRKREDNEQFLELEEFYNMNNREVFENFGVNANNKYQHALVANCLLLDSLLKEKYSELEKVYCHQERGGHTIDIYLEDGTNILAEDIGCVTIKRDGKEAKVKFDTKTIGEKWGNRLTDVNNLDVENVEYTGDLELIGILQKAMQEQFKSQRPKEDLNKELQEQPVETENILIEKTGAEKIIEFMKQNNLNSHDLSLAFTMIFAKSTDKTKAGQQIINMLDKYEQEVGAIRDDEEQ